MLTQDDLAERCGISQKYLSELERGEKSASLETLVALAHDGFQIRLAALLYSIDDELTAEARRLDEVLAGRPAPARERTLRAVALLLDAGEQSAGLPSTSTSRIDVAGSRAAEPRGRTRPRR